MILPKRGTFFFSLLFFILFHENCSWAIGQPDFEPERWIPFPSEEIKKSSGAIQNFQKWAESFSGNSEESDNPLALIFQCAPYCRAVGFADSPNQIILHPQMVNEDLRWVLASDPLFLFLLKKKDGSANSLKASIVDIRQKKRLTDPSESHESFGKAMNVRIYPVVGFHLLSETLSSNSNLQAALPRAIVPSWTWGFSYWQSGVWKIWKPTSWIFSFHFLSASGLKKSPSNEPATSLLSIQDSWVHVPLWIQTSSSFWIGPSLSLLVQNRQLSQDTLQAFSTNSQHLIAGISSRWERAHDSFQADLGTNIKSNLHDSNDYRSQPAKVDLYILGLRWQMPQWKIWGFSTNPILYTNYIRSLETASANTNFQNNYSSYEWTRESAQVGFALTYEPFFPHKKSR